MGTWEREAAATTGERERATVGIVLTGIRVSLVVGTALNLVNQYEALFRPEFFDPLTAVLNYVVPFCVSAYSGWRSLKNRQLRETD